MSRGGHPVAPLGSPDFPSTARSGTGSTPFSPFRVRLIADADLVVRRGGLRMGGGERRAMRAC